MLCAFKSLGVAFFLNNLSAHQASFINLRLHCALSYLLAPLSLWTGVRVRFYTRTECQWMNVGLGNTEAGCGLPLCLCLWRWMAAGGGGR